MSLSELVSDNSHVFVCIYRVSFRERIALRKQLENLE